MPALRVFLAGSLLCLLGGPLIPAAEAQVEPGQSFTAKVVEVTDGDTYDVRRSGGQVADTKATVLITGETGKGRVARALHDRSDRADQVFGKDNCAALPSDLIESELFGHEKGAFAGATGQREGRFELANIIERAVILTRGDRIRAGHL